MQYNTLGNTGLKVSALGFGASSLGGVFREISQDDAIRTVHLSLDLGVNFIDVSPFYGLTKAETLLGKALASIRRDKYILATKVGRYGKEIEDCDFSARRVTASVDESLGRLGVDHLDLIQCHDIEFGNLDQIINETLPALRKVQKSGKAKFVGITSLPLKALRYVVERAQVDTLLSYCHCQLNDTALLGLVPQLNQRGIGIISAAPLGMGLLSHRGVLAWHPAPGEVKAQCAKAAAHCLARGQNIEKLAIQYAVSHSQIATTVVSSADPLEMEQNIRCLDEPINQQLLKEVLDILRPIHNITWDQGWPDNN